MNDQKNANNNGMRHQVWRHRGCGLCTNPANFMCNQCRAEVNEQGIERTVHGMERAVHVPNVRTQESSVRT